MKTCSECRWWRDNVHLQAEISKDTEIHEGSGFGECHFSPPSIFHGVGTIWPRTSKDDFCSEWEKSDRIHKIHNDPPKGITAEPMVDAPRLLEALFEPSCRPTIRWVRSLQAKRKIPFFKVGGKVLFDVAQVREHLSRMQSESEA